VEDDREAGNFYVTTMEELSVAEEKNGDGPFGRIGNRSYGMLLFSIIVRAVHQVGAAIFLAMYLLPWEGASGGLYTVMVMGSGLVLVVTEWLRHRQLYREISGLVTMGKCLLLGAVIHGLLPAAPFVLIVFVLASLGAHAPKNIRHRMLW
jgi:hypothetical protein